MSDQLYVAKAESVGEGRSGGRVRSDDGFLEVGLAIPRELGGPGGGSNPEQLFAAGWAACFHSALKRQASLRKIDISQSVVNAAIGLHKTETGSYTLSSALDILLPGIDAAIADEIVEAAHQVCPYSVATRGNVPVTLTVSIAAVAS